MYTLLTIGENEYKLRLTTREVVNLEKRIGCNPMTPFMRVEEGIMPEISVLVAILHASLQKYHHGITFDKCCDLYDDYCEEHGMTEFMLDVVLPLYREAGIIPKETEENPN